MSAAGALDLGPDRLPWQVSALGVCLALDVEDQLLDATLRTLLGDLRNELRGDALHRLLADPASASGTVGLPAAEPVTVRGTGPWQVVSAGHTSTEVTAPAALSAVLTALNLTAVAGTPLLALHAAVLARDGAALVLPGRSGLGKTTTTAALLADGWDYLSDEAFCLRWSDGAVVAYPRPLALSAWATDLLGAAGTPGADEVLVRPDQLGGRVQAGPVRVAHVVLLERDGGPPRLRPAPRPQALEALLRRGFSTSRDPGRALTTLTGVLRTARAWTLHLGDPREAARLLSDRLA